MRWWTVRRQSWLEATFWALDLETTGLQPRTDQILSVGMLPVRAGVIQWGERFYTAIQGPSGPPRDTGALGVHQILPGDTEAAPTEGRVLEHVAGRLDGCILLVHHASVDVAFLKRAFGRAGLPWPASAVADTARLLDRLERRMERLEPYPRPLPRGLAAARARFGLPPHRAHHALADALATAELFLALRARLDAQRVGQLV